MSRFVHVSKMTFPDFPVVGKIAVITGAGSGINLAFARICIQQGAKVIFADLKLTPEASTFVDSLSPKEAVFVKCDVMKRDNLENLVVVSEKEFGDVPDVWIAGAGVFEPSWSNFWDDTEGDDYAQVAININHPIKLARIATRALLRKNKKGVVLIESSMAGFSGTFSAPLYCATKHAVVGFVRSMAALEDYGGVKVVAIAPGLVQTPLWTDYPEKMEQFGYSTQNSITPHQVAESMLSLVTEGKYPGGTCLERNVRGTRVLGTWNIEAPIVAGTDVPKGALERNHAPMREIIERERRVGSGSAKL